MLWQLALRNIWRNRRRTLLTLSAMVISSALLILCLGVFSGMLKDMLASATEQYFGHLVISAKGYQDDRDMFANFPADLDLPALRHPQVTGYSPRLRSFGLLSFANNSAPVELLGIRPQHEQQVTSLQDHLQSGRYLREEERNGAVIGAGLAKRLAVQPGDELVFVTQAADGSIGNDLLQVSGIFSTGDQGHDNSLVLVPLGWLQQLLVLPGKLHEISLRVEQPRQAAILAGQLTGGMPPELEVLDWGQMLPEMKEVVASYDVSRMIIVTILYIATGLGILNTFFMSVLERTREFGVLMAVGMRPGQIRLMVLLETLAMGLISLIFGVGLGVLLSLYMAFVGIDLSGSLTPITYAGGTILPRLHAVLETANILVPAVVLLLVCLLAGFLPANRAARMQPVVAIREE
ncbi:ABC-type transport system, involved in lipoprotein release, permease component [Malonomonas rubra DSM 5091]|uniref:ABC-type transport system, involved in lipoprotein release, permease component n=1 Tax=Malonomonas rubra DSM 5091 TaxID=1122189 RepID=A0A1M6DW94_MALRU|nr:FtsX-like permease family protein [Malonomonas rubra]SHI77491.1 ABC-type transport system, involved in lipoprotein release, permease component [Malonomonas rubra DSM 5091]